MVGGDADDGAVLLVLLEVDEVTVAGDSLEKDGKRGDFRNEGPGVASEGMEEDTVDDKSSELGRQSVVGGLKANLRRVGGPRKQLSLTARQ